MRTDGHIQVGILLYPGAKLAAVLGLTDLFALAGRLASSAYSRITPCGQERSFTAEIQAEPRSSVGLNELLAIGLEFLPALPHGKCVGSEKETVSVSKGNLL